MLIALVVSPDTPPSTSWGPTRSSPTHQGVEPVFVAEKAGPVRDSRLLTIEAQAGIDEITAPDAILVVGGVPAIAMARSGHAIVDWVRSVHANAQWTTSVCTGSLVLGAAGVLRGRRATSHWYAREMLRDYGAVPVDERVVVDGNIVTAAGVSAGIDMALRLAALWSDEQTAQLIQLDMEYAPEPPFDAGRPARAGAELTAHLSAMYAAVLQPPPAL